MLIVETDNSKHRLVRTEEPRYDANIRYVRELAKAYVRLGREESRRCGEKAGGTSKDDGGQKSATEEWMSRLAFTAYRHD